jgi:hypothetical protein
MVSSSCPGTTATPAADGPATCAPPPPPRPEQRAEVLPATRQRVEVGHGRSPALARPCQLDDPVGRRHEGEVVGAVAGGLEREARLLALRLGGGDLPGGGLLRLPAQLRLRPLEVRARLR